MTALLALVGAGDDVVCSAAIYGGTLHLLTEIFARFGVAVRFFVSTSSRNGPDPVGLDQGALVRIADQSDVALHRCSGRCGCLPCPRGSQRARQHVCQPGQSATAGARRRSRQRGERDEIPQRPM